MSSNDASELRIAIARVLERWQLERMQIDGSTDRAALLAEHIDELKRAITPTLSPSPFDAEVARAARQRDMPSGDRIAATEDWIHTRSVCDQCGAALAMVSDGDGSTPRLFCPQCQPEELPSVGAFPARVRAGTTRVRDLTPDEQVSLKAYLEFVQREPLPRTDAAARRRMEEAAINWPQAAALFGPYSGCMPSEIVGASTEEEWESPEVKAMIEGFDWAGADVTLIPKGRRLTQAETASFQPHHMVVTPEFAAWLDSQGLELVSIDDHGGGKASMTLAPIEDDTDTKALHVKQMHRETERIGGAALTGPRPPCPQCKEPGRVADVTANTFTCDACGSVWQRRKVNP